MLTLGWIGGSHAPRQILRLVDAATQESRGVHVIVEQISGGLFVADIHLNSGLEILAGPRGQPKSCEGSAGLGAPSVGPPCPQVKLLAGVPESQCPIKCVGGLLIF